MLLDLIGKLCSLLEEKKELFLQYEEATLAMLGCEADAMEQYIIRRDELANRIDDKNQEIARVCEEHPSREMLLAASEAKMEFAGVPSEYQCVFYGGQAVQSVISRIVQSDAQVVGRMEILKGQALEHVRQNKDVPKIKKYLTDLTEQPQQGALRSGKA